MPTLAPPKAPGDVVDYTVPFDGLETDVISGVAVVAATGGVSIAGSPPPSFTPASVRFWVTGGRIGFDELVTVTATTAGGRTFVRELAIPIRAL